MKPHFSHTTPSQRNLDHGFSLIEVLVALLVLSIGLLGLAMLQTTSLKFNTDSYSRTQATFLVYDIIDRMRTNPAGRSGGSYDVGTATVTTIISNYQTCKSSICNCDNAASTCSASNLALYDLGKWYEMQDKLLPGASSVAANRSTIARAGNTITITLRWIEQDLLREQIWAVEL